LKVHETSKERRIEMHKSIMALIASAGLVVSVAAWAQSTASSSAAGILRQARAYQFQFRAGQYDVVPRYVAMVEEATNADPDNADLSNALGVAYLAQAAGAMLTGGKPADAWTGVQKGMQALERAIQLDPDQAEALATHGGVQALMASFQQAPQQAAKGVAEMNRAVELAPKSVRVRLARAFNGLSLPDALRNHAAEAEDLDFLIKVAEGSRPGDYLHIMRGDLYFELGNPDLARNQYEMADKSASPATTEAQARLTALAQGGVPATDIKKLRTAAGANCAMCHGR
jgi:tetratricopeptide (TPR) repeat protein